jgi:peptidyl-prolyl cis-trans isomerase A (cyclophilin A)
MKHLPRALGATILATLLAAGCGGGGGDSGGPPPIVTASSASSVRYGETLIVTLAGSNLDQTLTLSSAGCRDFARSSSAPYVSGATVAYYTCRVSGVGSLNVSVVGAGATVATVPFTIELPQVSLLLSNGAGVAGTVVITLRPDLAPLTVDNFLAYVKSGFYNNTVFHRHARLGNLSSYALQAGGYSAPVQATALFPAHKATNAPIALEVGRGLSNLRLSVAMARTTVLDSATSEFFINTADNPGLDTLSGGYAVFGAISGGAGVVDTMVAAPCQLSPLNFDTIFNVSADCVPVPNIVIAGATQTR